MRALKTINGFRNTNEAHAVEREIEFRASGAAIFSNELSAPKAAPAPVAPV
jgi:hypothetical protein